VNRKVADSAATTVQVAASFRRRFVRQNASRFRLMSK
jgi:hypothetical protein